jgi:hypothetical protein
MQACTSQFQAKQGLAKLEKARVGQHRPQSGLFATVRGQRHRKRQVQQVHCVHHAPKTDYQQRGALPTCTSLGQSNPVHGTTIQALI